MSHAILSPSSASRWLTCTPSARLEQSEPDKGSVYAAEGTLAHSLGELLIKEKLGLILQKDYRKALKQIEEHELFNEAMYLHAQDYATFVIEEFNQSRAHTKDAQIILEERVNFSHLVPEGYGTTDVQIIADKRLKVIDLKYGKGVPVFAEKNKQLMLYALASLHEVSMIYDIEEVEMIIAQPRLDSISRYEIEADTLVHWGDTFVKPQAAKAFAGEGDLVAGDHCRFCKIRAKCKANYDLQMEITKHDFKDPFLLTPEETADVLLRATSFENWIKSVKEYALVSAVNDGAKWPGLKLVESRANRQYTNPDEIAKLLSEKGKKEDELYKKELIGLTAMQKLLGSSDFNTFVGPYLFKPTGKPALVAESDKRPELKSFETIKDDFKDVSESD
jgi:hypothetical protein